MILSDSTLQDILSFELWLFRNRGSNEVFTFEEVVDAIRSSSVADFFEDATDGNIMRSKVFHGRRVGYKRGGFHDTWISVLQREDGGHYAGVYGSISYRTIPQLIAALEKAIPRLEMTSHEIELAEMAENKRKR